MSQRIVRQFDGKDYYLDDVTSTKRSAINSAIAYRKRGFYARVTKVTDKRWGVWAREKKEAKK